MSYCRFGEDSDVYIFPHFSGPICCCACLRANGDDVFVDTAEEATEHLNLHRSHGDRVPDRAFRALEQVA